MTEMTTAGLRRHRLALALAALTALLLALSGTLANTASATVPSLQRVSATTAVDSNNYKTVTATCPGGTSVIGTSADIIGGDRQVVLTGVLPDYSLHGVTAVAEEDKDGTANTWQLKATAICAYVWTVELKWAFYYSDFQYSDSKAGKTVTAYCPGGKRLLGSGFMTGGGGRVVTDAVRPLPDLDGVEIHAHTDGFGGNVVWGVQAFAICASPPDGLERVAVVGPMGYPSPRAELTRGKIVTASCPSGKRLLGTGGRINHTATSAFGQVGMASISPASPLSETAIVRAFEDQDGAWADWSANAYAICAL